MQKGHHSITIEVLRNIHKQISDLDRSQSQQEDSNANRVDIIPRVDTKTADFETFIHELLGKEH